VGVASEFALSPVFEDGLFVPIAVHRIRALSMLARGECLASGILWIWLSSPVPSLSASSLSILESERHPCPLPSGYETHRFAGHGVGAPRFVRFISGFGRLVELVETLIGLAHSQFQFVER
jgi:hypothetical protein